jgi:hypothetical protein
VGLPEFVERVGTMVEDVRIVGMVDRAAHGTWYEEIGMEAEGNQTRQVDRQDGPLV